VVVTPAARRHASRPEHGAWRTSSVATLRSSASSTPSGCRLGPGRSQGRRRLMGPGVIRRSLAETVQAWNDVGIIFREDE